MRDASDRTGVEGNLDGSLRGFFGRDKGKGGLGGTSLWMLYYQEIDRKVSFGLSFSSILAD